MRATLSAGLLVAIVFSPSASPAHAQWAVTYLHPEGATESYGNGVSGVDEAGNIIFGAFPDTLVHHAALWRGTAESFVDMNPEGALSSSINATDGVHQVGSFLRDPGIPPGPVINRAAIWSGTAASYVDLYPDVPPFDHQRVIPTDTDGNIQVGYYQRGEINPGPTSGLRWNSTPESRRGLGAVGPGFTNTLGLGTDGISIVGSAATGTNIHPSHAILWKYAPDEVIDLHPAGVVHSEAFDVDGTIQVGHVSSSEFGGGLTSSALWRGSAASFVDMNPAGATNSTLSSADGGFQVGVAAFPGGLNNAGIWSGTPDSFINLHSFLAPSTYSRSEARSVWTDGTTVRIVGTAFNTAIARNEAILWTIVVPEPASIFALPAIGLWAMCLRRRRGRLTSPCEES